MRIEVLKIQEVTLKDGRIGTVLSLEDLKRLAFTYKITLDIFVNKLGLTRSLWDNSLRYHNITIQDIFSWRNLEITHEKLHLNSSHGFSRVIDETDLQNEGNSTKLDNYLTLLSKLSPDIKNIWYSKISSDPSGLSLDLANIGRDILECRESLKHLRNRVRKYAVKNGVKYTRNINSPLEHTVAKILEDLGVKFKPQFFIKPYHYDFKIVGKKILIEVDGGLHNPRFDEAKENKAKASGYRVIRIIVDKQGIKRTNYDDYKNKIRKELRLSGRV